jgi:hypothetical protein
VEANIGKYPDDGPHFLVRNNLIFFGIRKLCLQLGAHDAN